MRFLHTADWHLGHKFHREDRDEEFAHALLWLSDTIRSERIDALIIAGDIFDTDTPPNTARRLYFDFLNSLEDSSCRHVVIIAGNHDSPDHLEAPAELLRRFNVHVIGKITEDRSRQIVELREPQSGRLQAVVAAVPYLRERDLRSSQAMISTEERLEQLRRGIAGHYQALADLLADYPDDIPLLATGHLYARGGERDGRLDIIHLGGSELFDADAFPERFDYIALGHLHRPQRLGKDRRVCYSGSLLPLDFNEINYEQSVEIVEFEGKHRLQPRRVKVPLLRRLYYRRGSMDELTRFLQELPADQPAWVKLVALVPAHRLSISDALQPFVEGKPVKIISTHQEQIGTQANAEDAGRNISLEELSEMQVFQMLLEAKHGVIEPESRQILESTFKELLDSMQQKDRE